MSSQRANSRCMAAKTSGSACSIPPSVSSEKTTPKPNVSSGAFRSHRSTSLPGLSCLTSAERYTPPGPPPSTAMRTGQTAHGPDGRIVGGGVVPQFERALGNLLTSLGAAGGGPGDLVSLTVYLLDVDDYRAHAGQIGEVWRRLAGPDYPAMAAIGV